MRAVKITGFNYRVQYILLLRGAILTFLPRRAHSSTLNVINCNPDLIGDHLLSFLRKRVANDLGYV
jgi:hypothetical protein